MMYQYHDYNWKEKEHRLAYGFFTIFRKSGVDFEEADFYELNKDDIIMIPAIDMEKTYIITQPSNFVIDLPEGTKCIKFKEK